MRFQKVYLEITNVCNRSCSFCPGTNREPRFLSLAEFRILLNKLRPYTDYLYFHLMGEPLLHPSLPEFLKEADLLGFRVILTTNGTLLTECLPLLLSAPALHKINISLHSFEANPGDNSFADYLAGCIAPGRIPYGIQNQSGGAFRNFIVCYRLWNSGGADRMNDQIETALHDAFPGEWQENPRGIRLSNHTFLQYGEKFDWPEESAADGGESCFCYGLRDQIGILSDGTVVPCCLDHNGTLSLGNLFSQSLEEILNSTRAKNIYEGFSRRVAAESLCRHCGYARRFRV